MKNFYARVQYYVHDFTAIQDWFGNRGIVIFEGDLKEWCYDGEFLYFLCSDSAPYEITPCDSDTNVMMCTLLSIYYECAEEIEYADSPFANKL